MARDRASIRLDIWTDDDFRNLNVGAQHLYLHLLSSPTLSYAGVADWRPPRIAGMSKDATAASVRGFAGELVHGLFIVVDEETEEVLIRSYLKHDGLLHKPNVAKAMVSAYQKTASSVLRGVVVYELNRIHDSHPEWRAFQESEVSDLLEKPSVNPSERVPKGFGKEEVKGCETDPSLLTTYSLLLTPNSTHPATSPNEVREDVLALCSQLQDLIEANGSKRPVINGQWLTEARLLLDKDKREFASASRLIAWCQADSFWKANVLSMPTFRKKYDQLRLQANAELDAKKKTQRPSGASGIADLLSLGRSMDGGMEAIAQ